MRVFKPTTVTGSSVNTGRAVIRLGDQSKTDPSLLLPRETDLPREILQLLNERFQQIETRLRKLEDFEIGLAAKAGYGSLGALDSTARPVPGCKAVLDKLGTWLVLVTADFNAAAAAEAIAFAVIDPENTDSAKKQDAEARASFGAIGRATTTAWCLFTATKLPRLVQLYAKKISGGTVDVEEEGTSICALWVAKWDPGDKRFGRQIESRFAGAEDMNLDPLTDHGEEARWPRSDNPDVISHGVDQPGL